MNEEKRRFINRLCSSEGIIGALAIDQRGAWKKMIAQF
ncbi:MAG: tagatose-bisphosphate aldolase, partial [Enterococcus sp.]